MELIRQYFETSLKEEMSSRDWQIFSSKIVRDEIPKNQIFLKAGEMENYLSFVEEGIVRYSLPGPDDVTIAFVFANHFASAYDSFLSRSPSVYQARALTKCILWRITHEDLQAVYEQTTIGNKIGRHASEELFLKKFRRELSLLNESAQQRYLNLFTEQPKLLREIPLKYIASYIGITPQALSRIRKRIS